MFIPLGDDNSGRRVFPFVVWLIIALNCIVWFMQMNFGDGFTSAFSTIPFEITNGVDLVQAQMVRIGGQEISIPQAKGPTPIYLTILTSMFMHASWMHIIGNMAYLMIFGDQIEDILGHFRFALFYILCGIAASAAHIMVAPESVIPCLGASGAIAGVLGAYLIKHPSRKVRVLFARQVVDMPAFIVLGAWILLQLFAQVGSLAGEASGVAYMAHIGGFIAGLPLIFLFQRRSVKS